MAKPRSFLSEMAAAARQKAKGVGPLISGVWKKLGTPKGALLTGLGGFALDYAPEMEEGLRGTFNAGSRWGDGLTHTDEMLRLQGIVDEGQEVVRAREKRIKRLQRENMARVMQFAPDLAQSLMAGRELPLDAVVIGGQPRMDLMEQVARDMAMGRFKGQQSEGM